MEMKLSRSSFHLTNGKEKINTLLPFHQWEGKKQHPPSISPMGRNII
jgi:hypothetical protein